MIKGIGAGPQPQHPIKSPGNGTVAVNNSVNGETVNSGTELATAYNFNDIYVTARVAETDIKDVHPGQPVDISIDAFPTPPSPASSKKSKTPPPDHSASSPARHRPQQPPKSRTNTSQSRSNSPTPAASPSPPA